MRNIVLVINFDLSYQLKNLNLFDINGQGLIDSLQTYLVYQKNLPIFERLFYYIKRKIEINQNFFIYLSFSGIFLEQTKKIAPLFLKELIKITKNKSIILINQNYYQSLSLLFDLPTYQNQVKKNQDYYLRLFNQKPKIFLETHTFNEHLVSFLEEKNFNILLSSFNSNTQQNQKKIIFNVWPIEIINEIEQIGVKEKIVLASPLLGKQILATKDFHLSLIKEITPQLQINKFFSPKPEILNFNILQTACLNNLFSFNDKIKQSKKIKTKKNWNVLQHYSYYQNMTVNNNESLEYYRRFGFLLNQLKEGILNG